MKKKVDILDFRNHVNMDWNNKVILLILFILTLLLIQCGSKTTNYGIFAPSRLQYVKGQDGCSPVDFDQRYTMWTFGDTITDDGMISNSLAFTEKITTHNVTQLQFTYYRENGKVAQFIKNEKGEDPARNRLWAFDGVRIDNTVYVYYAHVYIQDPAKPLAFSMKESSLAYWNVPLQWQVGQKVQFVRKKNMFVGNVPAFGASVLLHNDYVYVVGHVSENNKSSLVIARVHKNNLLQKSSYEFLLGDSTWDKKLDTAMRFYDDVAGECSLSYDNMMRSFCIVYCQLFTGTIVMCMAKTIEALPKATKVVVYSPPTLKGSSMMYYSAKAIAHDMNQWYIVYMNPLDYQPHLVKVDAGRAFRIE